MAKRKEIERLPELGNKNYELIKQGYKVYPVYHKYKWWIEYEYNGEVTRFTKSIKQDEINLSIHKSILYLHKKIFGN